MRLWPAAPVALAVLAACARGPLSPPDDLTGAKWNVDAVAALEAPEDPYLASLKVGFEGLAREEAAEFDWVDLAYFTTLARLAAEGTAPEISDPAERLIGDDSRNALAAGRLELSAFLASPGGRLRAGRQMGEAQVHWECWLQEAEEGHQDAEIKSCREKFDETMILVRAVAPLPSNIAVVLDEGLGVEISGDGRTEVLDRPFAAGSVADATTIPVTAEEIREAFAAALGAQPPPPERFTLTFDFGSAALDDAAYLTIAQAAEEALRRGVAEVIVTGHADAVGGPSENLGMSRQRAWVVRREVLRELGAVREPPETISVTLAARGERELVEQTRDPSRPNRRVVILVR